MDVTLPGESAEYRAARDRLLDQEIELRRATEAVAEARRRLPPGGIVPEDYVFRGRGADGKSTDVHVSERLCCVHRLWIGQDRSVRLSTRRHVLPTSRSALRGSGSRPR